MSTSANLTLQATVLYPHRSKEYIWECAAKEGFGQGKTYGRSMTAKILSVLSIRKCHCLGISCFPHETFHCLEQCLLQQSFKLVLGFN